MKKTLKFLKHEFLEMLPPTIFFFLVFHVVLFTRALMAKEYGLSMTYSAAALIGALIVGKSVLIADAFPFVNLFSRRRLIFNIAWRTCLYLSIVVFFQFLEELISMISKYGSISIASEHFVEEMKWHQFWATNILFALFLIFYNLATGLIDAIGRDEFLNIFLSAKKKLFSRRCSPK